MLAETQVIITFSYNITPTFTDESFTGSVQTNSIWFNVDFKALGSSIGIIYMQYFTNIKRE